MRQGDGREEGKRGGNTREGLLIGYTKRRSDGEAGRRANGSAEGNTREGRWIG